MNKSEEDSQLERCLNKAIDEGGWTELVKEIASADFDLTSLSKLLRNPYVFKKLKAITQPPELERPYGRKVLHEDIEGEVLLVDWAKNMFCALHDHGKGEAIIFFLTGSYTEEFWEYGNGRTKKLSNHQRKMGDYCRIKAGDIHRVKSLSGGISLHFYVPNGSGMRIFDTEKRRTLWVTDDCGAWIDQTKVKKEKSWVKS